MEGRLLIKSTFPFIIIEGLAGLYLSGFILFSMIRSYSLGKQHGPSGEVIVGSTWRGLLWPLIVLFYFCCIPALIASVLGSTQEGAENEQ